VPRALDHAVRATHLKEASMTSRVLLKCIPLAFALAAAAPAWAQDAAAAQNTLKKSDCLKCHAVDKKKEGPSFKETAAKYKGKSDAEATLVKHMTSKPKVKVDGKEEEHPAFKGANEGEVKNVAQWILKQ
jgi:cytochrome c